jgi:hypothetical protein
MGVGVLGVDDVGIAVYESLHCNPVKSFSVTNNNLE